MKDILGKRVTDVKESKRLTDSPACLINPDGTMTSSMQKIMRVMNKDTSIPARLMEVNRDHPLLRNLLRIYKKDVQDEHLRLVTEQLYESALLMDGYLEDAHEMINRIENLMERSTEWYVNQLKTE